MGRGTTGAQQWRANEGNTVASQTNTQNQQLYGGTLLPGYQQMLANPGYSAEEKNAITQQSMGAANTAFDAMKQNAAARAARTNNSASSNALDENLARGRASQVASTAQQNQISFANEATRQKELSLDQIMKIYGINQDMLGKILGTNIAPTPSLLQTLLGQTGGAAGAAATAFSG